MLRVSLQDPVRRKDPQDKYTTRWLDVNRLEEILLQEMWQFGKELWESVIASLEEMILTEREGEMLRKSISQFAPKSLLSCLEEALACTQ